MRNVQALLRAPRVIKFTFTTDHLTLAQPPTGRGIAIPTVVIELSGVGSGITGPTSIEFTNVTRCLQYRWPYSWRRNRPVLDNTGIRIETRNAIASVAAENLTLRSESDDNMDPNIESESNEPDVDNDNGRVRLLYTDTLRMIRRVYRSYYPQMGHTNGESTNVDPDDSDDPNR
jgi:hypothetical protein